MSCALKYDAESALEGLHDQLKHLEGRLEESAKERAQHGLEVQSMAVRLAESESSLASAKLSLDSMELRAVTSEERAEALAAELSAAQSRYMDESTSWKEDRGLRAAAEAKVEALEKVKYLQ